MLSSSHSTPLSSVLPPRWCRPAWYGRGLAFDVQAVFGAGFVYALANANALLFRAKPTAVLVIGVRDLFEINDWTDRSNQRLFADVLARSWPPPPPPPPPRGQMAKALRMTRWSCDRPDSDGRYKDLLYVDGAISTGPPAIPADQGNPGGFRTRLKSSRLGNYPRWSRAGVAPERFDWIVLNQANIRIFKAARN